MWNGEHGTSSFFSKGMLDAVGVDERFHYMMDSDLWLKLAVADIDTDALAYGSATSDAIWGHHFR